VTPVVAIAAVAGVVNVAIPISPEERVEVRGAGPIVSPLGIGLLRTSGTSENPESAPFAGVSPPNETGGL
jgi:hypothetical protein